MSTAAYMLVGVIWLSLVGLLLAWIAITRPTPKKPLERDSLEATDAALRSRLVDLEDRFEHYVKREAVRGSRASREQTDQAALQFDRGARLQAVRERGKARGFG